MSYFFPSPCFFSLASSQHRKYACSFPLCPAVNNGVYQCGFSTTQAGFSKAEAALFDTLQELDGVLRWVRVLCGMPCQPCIPLRISTFPLPACWFELPAWMSAGQQHFPNAPSCPYSCRLPAASILTTWHHRPPPCSRQRFVCGERFTEADLRLFPTIVRFDAVYATLFKCCRRRVADHPHLQAWLRDVHQLQLPSSGLQLRVRDQVNERGWGRQECGL